MSKSPANPGGEPDFLGQLSGSQIETLGKLLEQLTPLGRLLPIVERMLPTVEANIGAVRALAETVIELRSEQRRQSAVIETLLGRIDNLEAQVTAKHNQDTCAGSQLLAYPTRASHQAVASHCQQSAARSCHNASVSLCQQSAAPLQQSSVLSGSKSARSRCGPADVGTAGDAVPIATAFLPSPPRPARHNEARPLRTHHSRSEHSQVFISRVGADTTPDDILKYVSSIASDVLSVSKLKTKPEYSSFVILAGKRTARLIADPGRWRVGTLVRPFRGQARADQVVALREHKNLAPAAFSASQSGNFLPGGSYVPREQ